MRTVQLMLEQAGEDSASFGGMEGWCGPAVMRMPAAAVNLAHLAALIPALLPAGGLPAPSSAGLSGVFREVQRLTEDPPYRLEEPAKQVMDNRIDTANGPRNSTQSTPHKDVIHRECRVDEDCGTDCYCLYEMLRSQCLPCKTAPATCTKDEECCGAQLCVWGRCTENATKGTAGSICQYQSNCSAELCCAYHEGHLLPMCLNRLQEQQHCRTHSNHLVVQLNSISVGEGPLDQCPCAAGLWCQSRGQGSVCIQHQNSSSEEDLTESLYAEIDYII
ncbi:dickkopf-related protein 3-like isoform X2 [Brienomyrus brachyistius]|uniref:dickkopf-related protein 3-like isoform X2 n=1 Tax=Brienomyrus brachyistius TaxID=42636 RepID=UPI0020B21CDD|nr:dickkopf-related protein 3-like isoform X2 [Brienomyrus brachyistius]